MIEIKVLNGKVAGKTVTARRFPFGIGRHKAADLCLEEPGVWNRHLELDLQLTEGITLTVAPEARATVNGQSIQATRLRNGDVIEIGAVRLRFGLAATRQRDLRLREGLTWLALAALCAAQIGLLHRL
jgi:hypothetical protein